MEDDRDYAAAHSLAAWSMVLGLEDNSFFAICSDYPLVL